MPNQDQCRFQNTSEDLRECYDALRDGSAAELDCEESQAKEKLVLTCAYILAFYGYNVAVTDLKKTLLEDRPKESLGRWHPGKC